MPSRAVLPRILGALFYYSPERPEVKALFDCLPTLPELYPGAIADILNHCVRHGRYRRMMRLHGNFPCCLKAREGCPSRPGGRSIWKKIIC